MRTRRITRGARARGERRRTSIYHVRVETRARIGPTHLPSAPLTVRSSTSFFNPLSDVDDTERRYARVGDYEISLLQIECTTIGRPILTSNDTVRSSLPFLPRAVGPPFFLPFSFFFFALSSSFFFFRFLSFPAARYILARRQMYGVS